MKTRVHVHLKAADLGASRDFYRKFLGVEPVKDKPDHVKFLPELFPLNLVLSPAHGETRASAVNHLGIEVSSSAQVEVQLERVRRAGLRVRAQLNVNCCYANQVKFWVIDPDGIEWEVYHVNYDLVEKHGGGIEAAKSAVAS